MEVYKLLGVLPDILEESGVSHPLIMYDSDGVSVKVRMPMSEQLESTPDRPIVSFLQRTISTTYLIMRC